MIMQRKKDRVEIQTDVSTKDASERVNLPNPEMSKREKVQKSVYVKKSTKGRKRVSADCFFCIISPPFLG